MFSANFNLVTHVGLPYFFWNTDVGWYHLLVNKSSILRKSHTRCPVFHYGPHSMTPFFHIFTIIFHYVACFVRISKLSLNFNYNWQIVNNVWPNLNWMTPFWEVHTQKGSFGGILHLITSFSLRNPTLNAQCFRSPVGIYPSILIFECPRVFTQRSQTSRQTLKI